MKSARGDIRPAQSTLQARPEVFDVVRVDAAFDVAQGMVDEFVRVVAIRLPIRAERIGAEHRSRQHVRVNARDERRGFVIRNDHRADAAPSADLAHAALGHFKDGDLARCGPVGELPHSEDVDFGRARFAADERLVHFDLARKGGCARLFHREADTVEHEPGRLLRHANRPTKFARGRAVLGVREEPDRGEPLDKRNRGILKDRPDLGRELPFVFLAAPELARLDELHIGVAAALTGASDSIRPAELNGIGEGAIRVRKVGHGFQESARRSVHAPSVYSACAPWVALLGAPSISI